MRNKTILFLACVVYVTGLAGCGSYPKVTSRESLDFIKQVYTACNTRNAKRLMACEMQLETLSRSGKISNEEMVAFGKVIELAKNEDWDEAQNQALKFAKDQVR